MVFLRYSSLILLVFVLCGCANNETIPPDFNFTTHISDKGFKLFQLAYPAPNYHRYHPNMQRDPGDQWRARQKYIGRVMEQAVTQSEYCRKGYIQLGRYAGETTERVRGECREKASEDDRQRFPNTMTRW